MKQLDVTVPGKNKTSYPIFIDTGLLESVMDTVFKCLPNKVPYIITDTNVKSAGHLKSINQASDIKSFVIDPPGEVSKTIQTVIKIVEDMEKACLGRDTIVIALGGGTVGDMGGFAASIFKRGVPVVQIPTTTVSQADSSVGGKTGVDSNISKNAFGTFYNPEMVFIDVQTLSSLDEVQYLSGMVETVKHAMIADAKFFDFLEQNIDKILDRDMELLKEIAYKNCSIKANVVANDPTEKNQRRILNYGHTIGHALESASNFHLLHGQAVGLGIIAAGLIEIEMGIGTKKQLERVMDILKKLKMPTRIPADIFEDTIIELLRRDKKAVKQWPKFVLLDKIGKAKHTHGQWAHDVDQSVVKKVLPLMY